MKAAKEKLLTSHHKLKDKFAVNTNIDDAYNENVHIRTDELSQNPLTGLFLVFAKGTWSDFPCTMQFVWIVSILVASGAQWLTTLLLYIYLRSQDSTTEYGLNSDTATRLLSAVMSCLILFIYVLGEIRKAFLTLQHYWAVLEVGLLQYWIFFMLIGDIGLQLAIASLSVLAIGKQDNISDQLGISLSFFFILELDEWMYNVFISDFDVLQEDDFIVKAVDSTKTDDMYEFYHKKALYGIVWGTILTGLLIYVVVYYLITN